MRALFLDASVWFASIVPKAEHHEVANARYADAVRTGYTLVTTPHVIADVHALVVRRRGPRSGQHFLDFAFGEGAHHVVYPDPELINAAIDRWIRRFADQDFSLCDAISFEVMRREGVRCALTFDRHFATAGFEILT